MADQGITRHSGEGAWFQKDHLRDPNEVIFATFGSEGFGTARSYFEVTAVSPGYNVALLSDEKLSLEIARMESTAAALDYHVANKTGRFADIQIKERRNWIESYLGPLKAEQQLRASLPPGTALPPSYPVMFDLDANGLAFEPLRYQLADEVTVGQPIELASHLTRVYVPVEHMDHMGAWLTQVLGSPHDVTIVPIESIEQALSRETRYGIHHAAESLKHLDSVYRRLNEVVSTARR